MKRNVLIIASLLFIAASCENEDGSPADTNLQDPLAGEWLVPDNEIFDGGPGKDGIPALSNPEFISPDDATYLNDHDLVLGFIRNGTARAYPHNILDWHEIVNDSFDDLHVAVI